jgi:hypothetical protein
MLTSKFLIYGLVDPRDGQLRYVGKTEGSLRVRLNHHVHRALRQRTNTYKGAWVRSVLRDGLRPDIVELEACPGHDDLVEAEQWHIAYWRSLGCRLTNLTAGGEGAVGYRHTQETRARISKAKLGVPHTEAWKLSRRELSPITEAEIVREYEKGFSCAHLAPRFGMGSGGIRKVLMRHGVVVRSSNEQRWLTRKLQQEKRC